VVLSLPTSAPKPRVLEKGSNRLRSSLGRRRVASGSSSALCGGYHQCKDHIDWWVGFLRREATTSAGPLHFLLASSDGTQCGWCWVGVRCCAEPSGRSSFIHPDKERTPTGRDSAPRRQRLVSQRRTSDARWWREDMAADGQATGE
jgi:hypothetical protein